MKNILFLFFYNGLFGLNSFAQLDNTPSFMKDSLDHYKTRTLEAFITISKKIV
jgi:hypothetical protein